MHLRCPTDKGFGAASLLRTKYSQLVRQQLKVAFTPVSENELEAGFSHVVRDIRTNFDYAETHRIDSTKFQ